MATVAVVAKTVGVSVRIVVVIEVAVKAVVAVVLLRRLELDLSTSMPTQCSFFNSSGDTAKKLIMSFHSLSLSSKKDWSAKRRSRNRDAKTRSILACWIIDSSVSAITLTCKRLS